MSETNHPTADRLEAFVEGVLEARDRAVIESHLPGCADCRAEVAEWRSLFTALSGLPQLDPAAGFAERVMAHVQVAPSAVPKVSWQERAAWAGALLNRRRPLSTFGWGLVAAMLALPALLAGGAVAWLITKDYVTPQELWTMSSTWVLEGFRGVGSTAMTAVMQTDVAVWLIENGAAFLSTAGMSGIGVLAATVGGATMFSVWILYRNLFRTPSRESNYVSYSF